MYDEEKAALESFIGYLHYVSINEHYVCSIAAQLHISEAMLKILLFLKTHPNGVRRKEIQRYFGFDSANMLRTMKRFKNEHYIRFEDRLVFISDEGNTLLKELHDIIIAMQSDDRPYDDYLKFKIIATNKHFW